MHGFQVALLASLLVVAAVHTKSRLSGAIAASAWCVGAVVFGALMFPSHGPLVFLGVRTPPWLYFAFLGGLLVFNLAVVARGIRSTRHRARDPHGSRQAGA